MFVNNRRVNLCLERVTAALRLALDQSGNRLIFGSSTNYKYHAFFEVINTFGILKGSDLFISWGHVVAEGNKQIWTLNDAKVFITEKNSRYLVYYVHDPTDIQLVYHGHRYTLFIKSLKLPTDIQLVYHGPGYTL